MLARERDYLLSDSFTRTTGTIFHCQRGKANFFFYLFTVFSRLSGATSHLRHTFGTASICTFGQCKTNTLARKTISISFHCPHLVEDDCLHERTDILH